MTGDPAAGCNAMAMPACGIGRCGAGRHQLVVAELVPELSVETEGAV
jgi:hypothetical protein